jgi:hypothetical protein
VAAPVRARLQQNLAALDEALPRARPRLSVALRASEVADRPGGGAVPIYIFRQLR